MADQELATLNAKIDKAEAYRDDLRKRIAQSGQDEQKILQEELVGVQNELSALQVRLNNLMEKQGENLASRSPPHRLSSPHACQHEFLIQRGASHELLGTSKGMSS